MRTAIISFFIFVHGMNSVNSMEAPIRIDFEKTPLQDAIISLANLSGNHVIIAPNMQQLSSNKPLTMHIAIPRACLKTLLQTLLQIKKLVLSQLDTSDTYILRQETKEVPSATKRITNPTYT